MERLVFSRNDAPISKVVVFRDRVEINRLLRWKGKQGLQAIVLSNIPTRISLDSLRVAGSGSATIAEIGLSECLKQSSAGEDETRLRDELAELIEKKAVVLDEINLLISHQKLWDFWAESLTKDASSSPDARNTEVMPPENLAEFLKVQAREKTRLNTKLRESKRELDKLEQDMQWPERNLSACVTTNNQKTWSIIVSLDVHEPGELELSYTYLTDGASWSPKYDIRYIAEESRLSMTYYGLISQSTGEDWLDVQLSLSTALAIQNRTFSLPDIGTKELTFQLPSRQPLSLRIGNYLSRRSHPRHLQSVLSETSGDERGIPDMGHDVSTVQDYATTSSFEIIKPSTIKSDKTEHKVMVGIIELSPSLRYRAIPKKVPHVVLEAEAVNTSPYVLLPGPANVFFESSFVGNIQLKTISPQETFQCSLGGDPSVRVVQTPVRRFEQQTGVVHKTTVVTYSQDVEVTNSRPEAIQLLIIEQIPRSTDEKIKVKLIEPALHPEGQGSNNCSLNQDNNLEHTVHIKGRSKYTWTTKYKMEYPSDKTIVEFEQKK